MKMRKILVGAVTVMVTFSVLARTETVKSPDGRIAVAVKDDGGRVTYRITFDGTAFLDESPLGLVLDCADYAHGLALTSVENSPVRETYTVQTIKQRTVDYAANRSVMKFKKNGRDALAIEWRVSNRDVAFRYCLEKPKNDHFAAVVKDELTGFVVPDGSTAFICPQMLPMGGFAGTAPSYETHYDCDVRPGGNGWGEGYTFPCLFRNGEKGWLLVSETGVDGSYCGGRLLNVGGNAYKLGFPQAGEMNGIGSVTPAVALPYTTPWRTITLGGMLAPIVESTVAWDVVEEKYPASRKYGSGRGVWSWIMKMDPSCNFDEQKRYVDFASAMGYETVLVDALWDTQIGYARMEELARYAASRQVGLYLWYNSNGFWNHAPQGPRGKMYPAIARKQEMAWLKKIGARGLKIDFFGGDKQQMLQIYEDILSDANDYGLAVIFHGCTLPRGWERMYPNFVSAEAVRASENLHFGQAECDREAVNASLYPYLRNAVGAMDFGGSALNKRWSADGRHGNTRRTSDVFALATAVLFQTPVNHFALAPNNLDDAPAWAIDFMKRVPTLWDEVRFIDGYPGKSCVLARRTGKRWFVAGVNAANEPLTLELDLSAFGFGSTCTVYSDDSQLSGSRAKTPLAKNGRLRVTIPRNGGLVITP